MPICLQVSSLTPQAELVAMNAAKLQTAPRYICTHIHTFVAACCRGYCTSQWSDLTQLVPTRKAQGIRKCSAVHPPVAHTQHPADECPEVETAVQGWSKSKSQPGSWNTYRVPSSTTGRPNHASNTGCYWSRSTLSVRYNKFDWYKTVMGAIFENGLYPESLAPCYLNRFSWDQANCCEAKLVDYRIQILAIR